MDLENVPRGGAKRRKKDLQKVPQSVTKPVELFESQKAHASRVLTILDRFGFALDLSMLGSGKTFTSSFLIQDNLSRWPNVVVICPVSVQTKWAHMQDYHGIPIRHMLS